MQRAGARSKVCAWGQDLEDVAGWCDARHASDAWRAEQDSIQVERLRVPPLFVGKMNTPEFGYTAITKNLLFGATCNPWNLDRTPGGSSGGASAGIAGGVVSIATAGDGGGSIRIPASFTGCFGLKTSYGRIPRGPEPLWINDDTAVYGPLTRTVEDAALFLDITAGPHPLDPNSLPAPGLSYQKVLAPAEAALRLRPISAMPWCSPCRGGARSDGLFTELGTASSPSAADRHARHGGVWSAPTIYGQWRSFSPTAR